MVLHVAVSIDLNDALEHRALQLQHFVLGRQQLFDVHFLEVGLLDVPVAVDAQLCLGNQLRLVHNEVFDVVRQLGHVESVHPVDFLVQILDPLLRLFKRLVIDVLFILVLHALVITVHILFQLGHVVLVQRLGHEQRKVVPDVPRDGQLLLIQVGARSLDVLLLPLLNFEVLFEVQDADYFLIQFHVDLLDYGGIVDLVPAVFGRDKGLERGSALDAIAAMVA